MLENKVKILFKMPTPYEIKDGIRFIRGTNNLVSGGVKIIAKNTLSQKSTIYSSITECSIDLNLDRAKIKECLLLHTEYKNYKFEYGPVSFA
jgi:hypothetical protein